MESFLLYYCNESIKLLYNTNIAKASLLSAILLKFNFSIEIIRFFHEI